MRGTTVLGLAARGVADGSVAFWWGLCRAVRARDRGWGRRFAQ